MAKPLAKLSPRHHAAIRMRVEGLPTEAICTHIGITRRTLYLWFCDDLIKREMQRKLARIEELITERMVVNAMAAMEALREALEEPVEGPMSYELKLRIICEILDRVPYTAKETVLARTPNAANTRDIVERWARLQQMWRAAPEPGAHNGKPAAEPR